MSAIEELQALHAELGAHLDKLKAGQPNDHMGIAIAASKQKGVGKAIEIVQRHEAAAALQRRLLDPLPDASGSYNGTGSAYGMGRER